MKPFIDRPQREVPIEERTNGCFETMRAYGGRIFRLESHLDRLYASAAFLATRAPSNRRRLAAALTGALARSGLTEAVVRVALMPSPGREAAPSIVVQPAIFPSDAQYREGLRIAVVPARKFSVASINPQSKYSARLGSVLAVQDAQLRGVDEALFLDAATGTVTESTASNLGLIARGAMVTPPCWLGLLAGITREVLFELARGLRLPVKETPVTRHELYTADEVFLTSTLKEVIGVSEVDGRRIGPGLPGPVTRRLLSAFRRLVRRELRLQA
jgi:branched-chain amino acid aminotransferase